MLREQLGNPDLIVEMRILLLFLGLMRIWWMRLGMGRMLGRWYTQSGAEEPDHFHEEEAGGCEGEGGEELKVEGEGWVNIQLFFHFQ
jgi:hypothetical protein